MSSTSLTTPRIVEAALAHVLHGYVFPERAAVVADRTRDVAASADDAFDLAYQDTLARTAAA